MHTPHHASRGRAAGSIIPFLLVSTLASTLTGCGGSTDNGVASKNATEILAAAKAAAASASSVHIEAHNAQGPLTLTVNLDLTSNGGRGHISGLGLDFEVIRTGDTLYLKGNPTFYPRLGITPARVPRGTWIKTPANSGQFAQLAAFTDLQGEVNRLSSSTGPITKGATTTINGQNTIELKDSGSLYAGRIYVATTGKPYPIQITKTGRETAHITLTNYNQPATPTPPTNTINISQLEHKRS
jgi:hypothetical protein